MSENCWKYVYLEKIDSTNNYIRENLNTLSDRTVITAVEQTSGKGRLGRTWASPPGGLYFSILWKPAPIPGFASRVSLMIADAICSVIGEEGINAEIKWPNDIIINNRKLGGILAESGTHPVSWLIVGVGLNLDIAPNLNRIGGKLDPIALNALVEKHLHPVPLLERFLAAVDRIWPDRIKNPLEICLNSINNRLWFKGKTARLARGQEISSGMISGIDESGRLILTTAAGILKSETGELILPIQ